MGKIPVIETPPPETSESLADKVHEKMLDTMSERKKKTDGSWLPLPDLKWGTPGKDWENYDGFLTKMINDFDPDFRTAKLGESVEMCFDSLNIFPNAPWVCLALSGFGVLTLKAKRIFTGGKTTDGAKTGNNV